MRYSIKVNPIIYFFVVRPGTNTVQRESDASSITIPFEQTFRNLDENRPENTENVEMDPLNYCGCGWPQHVLVPRGTIAGYSMVLFMIISDYTLDRVRTIEIIYFR